MAETTTTFPVAQLSSWTVPDNVFVIRADLAGGSCIAPVNSGSGTYARGGTASGLLPVTPGEVLQVAVGQAAANNVSTSAPTANGDSIGRGGAGTRPAGASSHVKRGSTRLIIAGGGGSTGTDSSSTPTGGGNGGGAVGGNAFGFGFPGIGGGGDPTYASGDGEAAPDGTSGAGGGGLVGGRAGRFGSGSGAYGAGGGGSGKVPAGGTMTTGGAAAGPGSAAITYGLAPYAPTLLTPAAGSVVPSTEVLYVSASANFPSPKDTLSARQVRLDGTFLYSGASDGSPVKTALLSNGPHTVEVRDANQHGTWGPWSAPATITVGTPLAAPTITAPVPGSTISTTPATVAWTPPPGAVGYRVRRVSDDGGILGSTVYSDTGAVTSTATSLSVDFPTDQRSEWVQVAVLGSDGLQSAWASARYPVQRTRPATPVASAAAVRVASGYRVPAAQTDAIDVTISNPTEAGRPAAAYCDVWAGPPGALAKVNRAPVPPNTVFRWPLPPGLVDHSVLVRAYAASGAVASAFAEGSPADGYGNGEYGQFAYGL